MEKPWKYRNTDFLDSFLFDNLNAYGSEKEISVYRSPAVGSGRINHFKQNVDGSWPAEATNSTKTGINGRFVLSNKYRGFTVSSFSTDGGITWHSGSVNQRISYYTGMLDIRYERNTYNLDFYNYNTTDKSVPLTYGKSMLGNFYTPSRPEGLDVAYQFKGWFKDKNGTEPFRFTETMPANDVVAYAKWEPPAVHGLVHLTISGEGIDNIKLAYGEPVDVGKLPTVVDVAGHVIVQGDSNYKVTVPEGYKWLGWATKTGKVYKKWNFKAKVQEDLELYPYYVSTEKVNVTYDVGEGSGTVVDEKDYLEGSEADVRSGKNVTPPEGKVFLYWKDDSGDIYYEGDALVVPGNITLHAVYGDAAKSTRLEYRSNYPVASGMEQSTYKQSVNGKTDLTNNTALKVLSPEQAGFTAPDGYYFDGWESADGDFTPGADVGVDNLSENVLKAKWVKKENLVITITGKKEEKIYNGLNQSATGYEMSYELAGKTITSLPAGVSVNTVTKEATGKDVGTYPMNLKKNDFSVTGANSHKYTTTIKVTDGQLDIKKADLKITTASDTKAYDGTPLKNKNSEISGLKGKDTITVTTTGSQTDVGSSKNEYTIEWGNSKKGNYNVESILGTLKVTPNEKEVELKADSAEKTYDGTALANSKVTWTGLPKGYKVEASTSGSQKDVGTAENIVVDGFIIRDSSGKDVTGYFTNVKKVNGTLRVTPKKVVLTSESSTKEYDGTALEKPTVSGQSGFVPGEVSKVVATGTITEEGSVINTISFTKEAGFKEGNYQITKKEGNLTVTKNSAAIVITAKSDTKKYDGKPLQEKGYDITGLPEGFTATVTVEGSIVHAGTTENVITKVIIKYGEKDVTSQFSNITTINGTLTVTKRKVIMTSDSRTKSYDGKPLTSSIVAVTGDGFVTGEVSDVKATGSITKVGSKTNTITYKTNGGFRAENYDITKTEGTLTVTKSEKAIVVTAPTKSKTYDGKPLSATNPEVMLPAGFKNYTVEATIVGSVVDVEQENVANKIAKVVVRDPSGNDVTDQFTEITKNNGTLSVTPKEVTLTSESATKEYDGMPLERPTVTGQNVFVAKVEATGTITEEGTIKNTISFTKESGFKDSNYKITKEEGTLTVTKNNAAIVIKAKSATKKYDGKPLQEKGYDITGLPAGFMAEVTVVGTITDAGTATNTVNKVVIKKAGQDVTSQFGNVTVVNGTLTVAKRKVSLTSNGESKAYNGKPLTNTDVTVGGDGFVSGEVSDVKATGSITKVGSVTNAITFTKKAGFKAENYDITKNEGTLTITKSEKAIVINAPTMEKVYDGMPLTAGKAEVILPEGFENYTAEVKITGTVTDVEEGNVENTIKNVIIRNQEGSDVTNQFEEVVKNNGSLRITPKAVHLVSESATKEYDGTPLERPQVTGQGAFVADQVSDVVAIGSITEEGSVSNTIAYKTKDGFKESNYNITKEEGTLTIGKNTAKILVIAASDTKMYDGKPLTNDGYTVTGLPEGFTVTAIVKGSAKNVKDGTVANKIVSVIIKDGNGKEVTAQFANVTTEDGKLSVIPRRIHLKSGDAEKKYNGKPLCNKKIITTGDGWAKGEGAKINVTGSRTKVGTSKNTFTYILQSGTDKDNYVITVEYGNLKVTKANGGSTDSQNHNRNGCHKKPVDTGDESRAGLLALLMGLSAVSFISARRRKER